MSFNTLNKAIGIFDLFLSNKSALGANEISDLLKMPRSTTYKYLSILKENRFLDYEGESGRYRLGFKFFELGAAVQSQFTIDKIALPVMKKLYNEIQETVILSALINNHAYCLERVGNENGMVYLLRSGSRLPIHCGALALVLLSFLEDDDIDMILKSSNLKKYTESTITDPIKIRERLHQIQKAGYVFSDEEVDVGVRALSAPIFDPLGKISAGLGIVGPTQRITDNKLDKIKDLVIQYAGEISRKYVIS